jgi:4-hydroxy-4-methyl-2-oxoglutarate aldolase
MMMMAASGQAQMLFGGRDASEIKATLYSAVLSDVLDEFGFSKQAIRPFVRPLDEAAVLFGRARTGLYMATYQLGLGENPYEVEIALVDDLKPGDVVILACGGPTERIAPWGELLSTAAKCRGAEGCVTDGLVRDVKHIRRMPFAVFHGGIGPLDTKGRARMVEMDTAVECGGVLVYPGDLVFGDVDGVVVIPQAKGDAVLARAFEKVTAENTTRDELLKGSLLREVYERHGVL